MNPVFTQQVVLDNALVAPKKRLKIEKCNLRIKFSKQQREATYQVTLDAPKLSPCYPAFLITAEVPEIYMHQFWNTINKIRDTDAYNFKLDKKKCRVDTENNVDYVALLWEDIMYQPDNREISSASKEHMPYPRFTKVIINHFISKDKTIFMRNRINLHTIRDDSLLGTLKFVSKTEDYQKYEALILDGMINQDIKDSKAYQTYYDFDTGKATPNKERKFKKVALPSRQLSPILEAEPVKKPKRGKGPVKKFATMPTVGVVIRDTLGVPVSKKKAPAKVDRGKGMDLLSDAALLEAAQLKEALKKSKLDSHMLHASGSSKGGNIELEVPDELKGKTIGIDEGTGIKLGVPDVPKYQSKSENESWGNSDENDNDDDGDDVSKGDDDDANSDGDGDNDASDSESTDSDDEEEVTQDDEYVHTPDYYVPTDEETNDENREFDEEEYDELYMDSYEQVVDDAHVTLTATQKTEGSMQSSSVSFESASKFLNLDNALPVDDEVAFMMNVKPLNPIPQQSTPTPAPITVLTTTFIPALPDFSSLFGFDQRVSTLEKELSQFKQADHSAQILASIRSQIPVIMDEHLSKRIRFTTQTALQSYTTEFEKKAQEEKDRYINLVEKSIKDIIKDEVKSQLPQILPKEVSNFSTLVIQSTNNESLENVILLNKLQKSNSYLCAPEHKELYDGLVKSYKLDKDLFESYGEAYSLKRSREDKDKDEDPPAGSDQGLKKRKMSKDSVQAKEPVFETANTKMPQDQGGDSRNTEDQPNVEEASKHDWFKKPKRPLTHAFNLLKGTWKSRVELEYHFEDCYKVVIDRLDWNNPKGQDYPFDLSKPLLLIKDQGHQVVPVDYFINNDLEYLKGRSSSKKYTTSITKTKAAKYDNIEGIKDMVLTLWSPVKVSYNKYVVWESHTGVLNDKSSMATQATGSLNMMYLEEIVVQREDNILYNFKEGDFLRLNLHDIEDMLFLLVQKKLSNLERDVIYDLNVALRMFTERRKVQGPCSFSFDCENNYSLYSTPHYTKNCLLKEEGETLEEAYYTQFGAPYQPGGQYRAEGPGFYQRNNRNSSYPDRRQTLEESLTKFMAESAKRHEENANIIKEIQASIDAAIRNQGASIKT
ncbi:hypothetical protein Tco_0699159 [Tanacetum coccineum]